MSSGNAERPCCTAHISGTDVPPELKYEALTACSAELDGYMPRFAEKKGSAGRYIAEQIDWPQD